jgi:tetratricopeptide (TPR) repeat protein
VTAVRSKTFVCLLASLLFAACQASAQQPNNRLAQWEAAVKAHKPGGAGKATLAVADWPGFELEETVLEVKRLVRTYEKDRLDEGNDLLLHGAGMHADIARLIPHDLSRQSPRQQRIFIVSDGREQGTRFVSLHWDLGRSLLDGVSPPTHPAVLEWYHQTSTDLMASLSLAEAAVHLPRARRIFPADPTLLYLSGILHERFSSAPLQAAAEAVVSGNSGVTSVSSARVEQARAERFFRDALAARPDHLEARVRYGHVLGELGRHAQAAAELRSAIDRGASGRLLYWALLFLGKQDEMQGNRDRARLSYERAADLFPRAQSPRLALSQLARRTGDRRAAQRQLAELAGLPADERQREDPWWDYYDVQ